MLYDAFEGRRLSGPNDVVFDEAGGFWFTDLGKTQRPRARPRAPSTTPPSTATSLTRPVFPAETPNGIGLSPDGGTVYYAETTTARLRARRVTGPGALAPLESDGTSSVLAGLPGFAGFDSLAVDAAGNVCVATLITGGITVVAPDSSSVVQYSLGDQFFDELTTNICFGGPDLRTAYITLGGDRAARDLPLAQSPGSAWPSTAEGSSPVRSSHPAPGSNLSWSARRRQ